jgi:hypothetical protein
MDKSNSHEFVPRNLGFVPMNLLFLFLVVKGPAADAADTLQP